VKRYAKGCKFEQLIRKAYEAGGWQVFRCVGSKPVDLVCLKRDHQHLLVECRVRDKLYGEEREYREWLARRAGARLVIVRKSVLKRKRGKKKGECL